jgi:hypothetical protein
MRAILAFVVLLAAAKFGYQEWVYRTALVDTLINTFRQDAVERCQKESKDRNLEVGYSAWSDPESFQLIVGRGSREVSAGVSGEAAPEAGPILVIVARKEPAKIQCEFDIMRMSAAVYQL